MIIKIRLYWFGHAVRVKDSRRPKAHFYGQLNCGTQQPGRPCLNALNSYVGLKSMAGKDWRMTRTPRRMTFHEAVTNYKEVCNTTLLEDRQRCQENHTQLATYVALPQV